MSAILDDSDKLSNAPMGITLTVIAQFFAATQMVVEELFVKGYRCPPSLVVGSEGAWGILMMCVILGVMYIVPGSDAGSYENAIDSVHMLFGSGSSQLRVCVGFYLVSISL